MSLKDLSYGLLMASLIMAVAMGCGGDGTNDDRWGNSNILLKPSVEKLSSGLNALVLDKTNGGLVISVDSENNVHMGYGFCSDTKHYLLRYATNKSGSWLADDVYKVSDAFSGPDLAIAVDNNDKIHFAFGFYCWDSITDRWNDNWCGTETDLIYATNMSGEWKANILDDSSFQLSPSLVITRDNAVHLAYYNWNDDSLKYAKQTDGKWNTEVIASTLGGDGWLKMVIDSKGAVHIAYASLRYVTNVGQVWNDQVIDFGGYTDYAVYRALAIDANDNLHLVYAESGFNMHYLVLSNGVPVSTEEIEVESPSMGGISMAIDKNGKIHIIRLSATTGNRGQLLYLTNSGGKWQVFTIDDTSDCYEHDLAIDANGNLHVVYADASDEFNLSDGVWKYVTFNPSYFVF